MAESSLKITFPDGNRDLVLRYVSHQLQNDAMTIVLKDIERDVFVTLHYEMDAATGILARWAEIENRTKAPFVIEQAESAEWNLPASGDYVLRYLAGRWGGEDQLTTRPEKPGETVPKVGVALPGTSSRRGLRSPQTIASANSRVRSGSVHWRGADHGASPLHRIRCSK